MSVNSVKAPVEVTFKATGVPEVQKGLRLVGDEAGNAAKKVDGAGAGARRTGNSLNILAASAASGVGSLTGLAAAAGNVAEGMAAMSKSATIAASAAGIGVLIGALGVLVALAIDAKKKLTEIPTGTAAPAALAHLQNLKTEKQVDAYIAGLDQRRAGLQANVGRGDEKALQAIVNLDAQREAALLRQRAIVLELRDIDKTRADKAKILADEAKRAADAADLRKGKISGENNIATAELDVAHGNAIRAAAATNASQVQQSIANMQTILKDKVDVDGFFAAVRTRVETQLQSIIELAGGLSNGIGEAVAAGLSGGFKDAARSLVGSLGSMVKEFGTRALAAVIAAKLVMENFANPAVGIPAAIALIALGSAMQSYGRSGGSGGGGGGGGSYGGGGYATGSSAQIIDRGIINPGNVTPRTPINANFTVIGPNDPNAVRGIDEILRRINQNGSLAGSR